MRYNMITKMLKTASGALIGIALMAGPSLAVELAAVQAEWLPPDSVTPVAMWGFIEVPDAAAYACPGAPVSWDVGPTLDVPDTAPLTINLKNCLAEDISIFIPGQIKPTLPVTFVDPEGRTRVSSFDVVVHSGNTGSYTWSTPREGTYLYQSGTFVAKQVPKGLYGPLIVRGSSYPAVAQEEVLVYSEIDPVLNNAGGGAGEGARVNNYVAKYFLVNGETAPAIGNLTINTSEDVLLRFVNAGLRTYVPTLQGQYMHLIAEDGNLYPYALDQYQVELQAAKTVDALINVGSTGTYALYDRSLHLTNSGVSDGSSAGLVTYIQAGTAVGAPTVAADNYTTDEDTVLTATAGDVTTPGVLDNDTGAVEAVLLSGPTAGTLTTGLAADGSFSYTPNPYFNGIDSFTYAANDGLGGPNSSAATVTITVNPVNNAPVANPDSATVPQDTPTIIDVAMNDTDVDGNLDPTSVTVTVAATNGVAVSNGDGTITYTPNGGYTGPDSFDYQICDTAPACASATVTIDVTGAPSNIDPIANDDTTSTPKNTPLVNYNIVANDEDPDGTIDPTTVVITTGATTTRGGTVVNNGDGTITFTPKNGFRGTDTFQYTVNDNGGATSNTATVNINVTK